MKLKFEVKVKDNALNLHPIYQVANIETITSPAHFIVTYVGFHSNSKITGLAYGKCLWQPQFTTMYTGAFTFMPADTTWLHDPLRNPSQTFQLIINSMSI